MHDPREIRAEKREKKMKSRDRLEVVQQDNVFYLVWYLADDGDYGGFLGEHGSAKMEKAPIESFTNCKDAEVAAAFRAVKALQVPRDRLGFWFESRNQALGALRVANAAMKNIERPMPAWAVEALKAGWKMPKGWKP